MNRKLDFKLNLQDSDFAAKLRESVKKVRTTVTNLFSGTTGGSTKNHDSSKNATVELIKFDKIITAIRKNFREMNIKLRGHWAIFKKDMEGAGSIREAGCAFSKMGISVGKTLVNACGVWGKIALAATVAMAAMFKLSESFQAVERSSLAVGNAFKTGGKMAGTDSRTYTGRYSAVEDMALQGKVNKDKMLSAIGYARKNFQSLDQKTMDRVISMAPDLGAFSGSDPSEAVKEYLAVLDDTSVSYEKLTSLGITVTRAELNRLNALKSVGKQEEANAILLKKIKDVSADAYKEQESTLFGQLKTFWSMMKEMFVNIGKIVAPLLKFVMKIVNAVTYLGGWIVKIFAEVMDELAKLVDSSVRGMTLGLYDPHMRSGENDKKKTSESNSQWVDPRLQMSAQFESMDSMSKRIQTSIVQKNSPGERQVHLLTSIIEEIKGLHSEGRRRTQTAEEQKEELRNISRNSSKFRMGVL